MSIEENRAAVQIRIIREIAVLHSEILRKGQDSPRVLPMSIRHVLVRNHREILMIVDPGTICEERRFDGEQVPHEI